MQRLLSSFLKRTRQRNRFPTLHTTTLKSRFSSELTTPPILEPLELTDYSNNESFQHSHESKSKEEKERIFKIFSNLKTTNFFAKEIFTNIVNYKEELEDLHPIIEHTIKEEFENPNISEILINKIGFKYLLLKSESLYPSSFQMLVKDLYIECIPQAKLTFVQAMIKFNFHFFFIRNQILVELNEEIEKEGKLSMLNLKILKEISKKLMFDDFEVLINGTKMELIEDPDEIIILCYIIYTKANFNISQEYIKILKRATPITPEAVFQKALITHELSFEDLKIVENLLDEDKLGIRDLLNLLIILRNIQWGDCLSAKLYKLVSNKIQFFNLIELHFIVQNLRFVDKRYQVSFAVQIFMKTFLDPKRILVDASSIFSTLIFYLTNFGSRASPNIVDAIDLYVMLFYRMKHLHFSELVLIDSRLKDPNLSFVKKVLQPTLNHNERIQKAEQSLYPTTYSESLMNRPYSNISSTYYFNFLIKELEQIIFMKRWDSLHNNIKKLLQEEKRMGTDMTVPLIEVFHANISNFPLIKELGFELIHRRICGMNLFSIEDKFHSQFFDILNQFNLLVSIQGVYNAGSSNLIIFIRNNVDFLRQNLKGKILEFSPQKPILSNSKEKKIKIYIPCHSHGKKDAFRNYIPDELYLEIERIGGNLKHFQIHKEPNNKDIFNFIGQPQNTNNRLLIKRLENPELREQLLRYFDSELNKNGYLTDVKLLSMVLQQVDIRRVEEREFAYSVASKIKDSIHLFSSTDLINLNNSPIFRHKKYENFFKEELSHRINLNSINHFDSYEILMGFNLTEVNQSQVLNLMENIETNIKSFDFYHLYKLMKKLNLVLGDQMILYSHMISNLEHVLQDKRICPIELFNSFYLFDYGRFFLNQRFKDPEFLSKMKELMNYPTILFAMLSVESFHKTGLNDNLDNIQQITDLIAALFTNYACKLNLEDSLLKLLQGGEEQSEFIKNLTFLEKLLIFACRYFDKENRENLLSHYQKLNELSGKSKLKPIFNLILHAQNPSMLSDNLISKVEWEYLKMEEFEALLKSIKISEFKPESISLLTTGIQKLLSQKHIKVQFLNFRILKVVSNFCIELKQHKPKDSNFLIEITQFIEKCLLQNQRRFSIEEIELILENHSKYLHISAKFLHECDQKFKQN